MIDLISWPPRQYGVFKVKDQPFTWDEKEPFITRKRDGKVDLDHTTPGFVNRILRYGKQNLIPPIEWHEEKIYSEICEKIPPPLREKFFRKVPSSFPNMPTRLHSAPIPPGFAEAAKLAGVADNDPDLPAALARQSPEEWLNLLHRWLRADKANRENKHVSGPAWWFAAHSVSLNPSPTINPLRFTGQWIGSFPCRHCRIDSRRYIARVPVPGWAGFEQWISDFHNYVTERKK